MVDDIDAEKKYPTYIINRCLSSFTDTVLFANEMNKNPHLPTRLQYDFYINSVKIDLANNDRCIVSTKIN